MTLQNTLRIATVLAIVGILPVLGLAEPGDNSVAYLEGTITDVPTRAAGELDLKDSENLHFRYGDITYSIPSESLTSYEWGRPTEGLGESLTHSASKVGRAVLPMLYDHKFLTIRFKNDDERQSMVFSVPKNLQSATDPILATWVKRNRAERAANTAAPDHDAWWGNRYWKTKRNRHLWEKSQPDVKPQEAGAVASRDEE